MKRTILIVALIMIAGITAVAMSSNFNFTPERISPQDRIVMENLEITDNTLALSINGALIVAVSDTNSMDPVLDEDSLLVVTPADSESGIAEGDIIIFHREEKLIVHRVISVGTDENGWFAITKGDNNLIDDGKIRGDKVMGVVVGILY